MHLWSCWTSSGPFHAIQAGDVYSAGHECTPKQRNVYSAGHECTPNSLHCALPLLPHPSSSVQKVSTTSVNGGSSVSAPPSQKGGAYWYGSMSLCCDWTERPSSWVPLDMAPTAHQNDGATPCTPRLHPKTFSLFCTVICADRARGRDEEGIS